MLVTPTRRRLAGTGWVPGGRMRSMVVVMDIPDTEGVGPLLLRGPFTGVKELLGQDSVVALRFFPLWRGV